MTRFEARQTTHSELESVTSTLIAEFSGVVPAGTVIRCVAQAREQLLDSGVRAGLAAATESAARIRLRQLCPAHGAS